MPQERLTVRKIREVLRLKWECQLSERVVARSCCISHSTVGVACFGAGDHPGSPDRVFELAPVSIEANESCKALIAGFTGTTGAEFLDWGLKLAEERLSVLSERRKIILIIHDGRPVYQGEEGNDWELSLLHLHKLEARGITPIGVYLGSSSEDLVQLKQLFPRLVHTSGNALPDRLGDLLRGLVG